MSQLAVIGGGDVGLPSTGVPGHFRHDVVCAELDERRDCAADIASVPEPEAVVVQNSTVPVTARNGACFVLASTSEVHGGPAVHPRPEHCRGNADPVGTRSVSDGAKRRAEAPSTAPGEGLSRTTDWCRAHLAGPGG